MNEKIKYIVNTCLFTTIFIAVFLLNVLTKDSEVSNSERRKLKQLPELSWSNILDTSFMDSFDKYVLDQFIFRDTFRYIKADMELNVLNKKDNNDLFVYNEHIFKNLYPLNEKEVLVTAKKINYIYDLYLKDMNVYYTIIPDKNYYLSADLDYLRIDYKKLISIMNNNIENMKYIDIFNTLNLTSYYKTDIHWKQYRLHDASSKIANHMNFTILNDYDMKIVPNFKGSYYGQIAQKIREDNIVYLTNNMIKKATVFNHETNKYTPIYDLDKKNNVDMYDTFLSGSSAILDIYNEESTSNKELIVFRDSFGSSLIPLLIKDYKKITVIDIRYISSNYLSSFIDFNNQDVLFMYSTNIINNGSILR